MLVAMLVNYQAIWAALVALFFAALNIGSIQLPLMMRLDSTLSGVIQGALVLAVLMMDGVRRRLGLKK
jgi:simple sugar transport system permease protein